MPSTLRLLGAPGHFFEAPRWHAGRWWVSDFYERAVFTYAPSGDRHEVVRLDDRPSGLGWLPDGTLLIVSMDRRQILKLGRNDSLAVHADLGGTCPEIDGFLNDMVVDGAGRAYVGFDASPVTYGLGSTLGRLFSITPDGAVREEARGLGLPNGMVIDDTGKMLVVGETLASRLTSFDIDSEGRLGSAQLWADLNPSTNPTVRSPLVPGGQPSRPDGCSMDAEGHIWIADLKSGCLRLAPGGAVSEAILLPEPLFPWACMLGGERGLTLLICAAPKDRTRRATSLEAVLLTTEVNTPHGGCP